MFTSSSSTFTGEAYYVQCLMLTCILLRQRLIFTLSRLYVFQIPTYQPCILHTNTVASAAFSSQDVETQPCTHAHTHAEHASRGKSLACWMWDSNHNAKLVYAHDSWQDKYTYIYYRMHTVDLRPTSNTVLGQNVHMLTSGSIFQVRPLGRTCLVLQIWSPDCNNTSLGTCKQPYFGIQHTHWEKWCTGGSPCVQG